MGAIAPGDRGRVADVSPPMKRVGLYVLAGLVGAALGYFFSPDCPEAVGVATTCEEQVAAADARCQRLCDERIDKSLADRPRH